MSFLCLVMRSVGILYFDYYSFIKIVLGSWVFRVIWWSPGYLNRTHKHSLACLPLGVFHVLDLEYTQCAPILNSTTLSLWYYFEGCGTFRKLGLAGRSRSLGADLWKFHPGPPSCGCIFCPELPHVVPTWQTGTCRAHVDPTSFKLFLQGILVTVTQKSQTQGACLMLTVYNASLFWWFFFL